MPAVVLMPALSPTMTEGHLVRWHKSVGDKVSAGDLLMDIETDKAVMEVEATQEGILARILVPAPAESISVGTALAYLKQEGENDADIPEGPPTRSEAPDLLSGKNLETPEKESPKETLSKDESFESLPSKVFQSHESRQAVSPLARKLAAQHSLDLATLTGSGPRGRIVKKDIEAAMNKPVELSGKVTSIPLSSMRKVIAQRLTHSKQTIPHFYVSVECVMDELLALRQRMNEEEKLLSVNDFMASACAQALAKVPEMRILWGETQLAQYPHVDLAVAVSIPGGLITPIVKAADTKSLKTLARELKDLIVRARAGKLRPEEYQGGTFTLSNLGMSGVSHFLPIINPPHSGILAIGASLAKPVIKEGGIVIAQVMTATVAADHRVVDGEVAAKFMMAFKKLVEHPYRLLG